MSTITLPAFCLDEEFESLILEDHNVRIIDRTDSPWNVTFEGSRENLISMVRIHWSEDDIANIS